MPVICDDGVRDEPPAEALDLGPEADPREHVDRFDRVSLIRVAMPGFADGRAFSIARRLRDLGYRGRLRAAGPMLPDQYGHARACGFDEVEITPEHHARTGEAAWRAATWAPVAPARLRAAQRRDR